MFCAVFFDEVSDFVGLVEMPLDRPAFIPCGVATKIVSLDHFAIAILGSELIQHSLALGIIAVRCKPHRLAFAVAVPPTESFSDVAVKPAERTRIGKRVELSDLAILTAP